MPYFSENINFHPNGEIQSQNGKWIMMEWEREIMEASARAICINGGDILNVGFGMGIIDSYIQLLKPKTHWIIEGHPEVQKKIIEDGWLQKPNVKVIFKPWQEVYKNLPKFDGIYFDTWEDNQTNFDLEIENLLKPKGIYSFFNNPGRDKNYWLKDDLFMHAKQISNFTNLNVEFDHMLINSSIPSGLHYWHHNLRLYHIPKISLK